MKDSEFLELLNLYLDHEITAADAARLEAEVQASPKRRQIYQQYCRMQKACTLLAKDFADEAAPAEVGKVVAFEAPAARRSAWSPGLLTFGGVAAAAACLAVVLVSRNQAGTAPVGDGAAVATNEMPAAKLVSGGMQIVPQAVETKVVVAPATGGLAMNTGIAHTVSMPVGTMRRTELQPVVATHSLFLTGNGAVAQPAPAETVAQLDWIKGLQLAPMQQAKAEDLRFEATPAEAEAAAKNPTFTGRSRPLQQGVVELTAFQFKQ